MDQFFFILSKLAWIFLSPSNLILLGFILGTLLVLLGWRYGKRLLVITSMLAASILAYPLGDFMIQPLEKRFAAPTELPSEIDGILILGGGEDLPRSLSWGTAELGLGGDRYIAAKALADHYPNAPVIFSGGSGSVQHQNTLSEGKIARQLLTTLGIASERLVIESKSRNTYENFTLVHPLLPKADGTYLLVTSAFHMPRSVGIARQAGVRVIAYPVDYRSNSDEIRQVNFDFFDHLKSLEPAWKEWIGLTVYYWTDKTSEWFPKAD